MANIGFVGLGHMGMPMVRNLMKAGHKVCVFDIHTATMATLVHEGAIAATDLADVVRDAEFIITMLQTGEQVQAVCLGNTGLFANAKGGTIFIDSSSIDVSTTRDIHREALQKGFFHLDAPVSGGVAGAETATLTFMVGGEASTFLKAKPILENMGKKIIHAGPSGNGQAAKICNNLILGISMIAVSEAFVLAEKLGLPAEKLFEISSNASGQCWSMTSYCPVPGLVPSAPSNREYQAGFTASMMLKDLRLSQAAAHQVGLKTAIAECATNVYNLYESRGFGHLDFSGVINMIRTPEEYHRGKN